MSAQGPEAVMFAPWYLVYTKPRKEDMVSDSLRKINIEVYNPKFVKRHSVNGVQKEHVSPLFPCYIFVKLDIRHYARLIRYTRGVKKIVDFDGSPSPVPEDIISMIQSREKEGLVEVMPAFKEGDMVVIKDGHFKDFIGVFQKELSDSERVIILLSTLSSKRIVLNKSLIEKL